MDDPKDPVELSVVIPCLNEANSLALCIQKALRAFERDGIAGEVIVSDNGSTDGSQEIAARAGASVVACPVRGYGAALQTGFAAARGKYLLMGDADDSYDFDALVPFLEKLRAGASFVTGSRLRGTIEPGAMPFLNRHLGTPVLSWLVNRLFGTRVSDCQCGMRAFSREAYSRIGAVAPGMEFVSEMIVRASIAGIPVSEIPIKFYRDKRGRAPHMRPWRDGWRNLRMFLWFAPDQTMTLPGLALLLLGSALTLWQLFGPYRLGSWLFDIHYMVLGLTLAMLGLPAFAMGLAVHTLTPERKFRRSTLLGDPQRWFTFDRAMIVAGLLFVPGLALDSWVLLHWLSIHCGPLSAIYTRFALAGLLLIVTGFQAAVLGLLVGSVKNSLAVGQPGAR
jgi:glycosyltransferase involved in cell wall biosynthesis